MNKNELANAIADRMDGVNRAQAGAFLEALTGTVQEAVAEGEKVVIPGFGTWERKFAAARTATNPATGGTVDVPARYRASFKVGSVFKGAVLKGETA